MRRGCGVVVGAKRRRDGEREGSVNRKGGGGREGGGRDGGGEGGVRESGKGEKKGGKGEGGGEREEGRGRRRRGGGEGGERRRRGGEGRGEGRGERGGGGGEGEERGKGGGEKGEGEGGRGRERARRFHKMPARFVGPYAQRDPAAALELWEILNPILDREGTRDAYRLEVDLLPLELEMRLRGIRIDQDAAEQARDLILQKRDAALAELSEQHGALVGMDEINGRKWKEQTFDKYGIKYPHTAKGNPSFAAGKLGWMAQHPHWLPQLIAKADKYEAAGTTFLQRHILNHIVRGRIHAELHSFRSEDGGTRSLRFSYSDPPLQQMPARDEELAPQIRRVFLPEDGERWASADISQQEFRHLVHHAELRNLPGAKEAAEYYRSDPDADYHAIVGEIVGLDRGTAKHTNFSKIYGAGLKKFAAMIGRSLHAAQTVIAQYDRKLPFVSYLSRLLQKRGRAPRLHGALQRRAPTLESV